MKKLKELAQQLHDNNYVMTESMKEHFEDFLSTIAKGARVLHPRFGLGTVTETQGNSWIVVEFDRDIEYWESRNKMHKANSGHRYDYVRPSRAVMISSCTSIHMLIKREQERLIKKDFGL